MFINYFKHWLYQQLSISDYRIFKSYFLKVGKKNSFVDVLKDRILLFVKVLIMPIFIRFKQQNNMQFYIIDNSSNYKLRQKYIEMYDGIHDDIGLIDLRLNSPISIRTYLDFFRFIKCYIFAIISVVKVLFLPLNFSFVELASYFYLRTKVVLLNPKKVYIFHSYLAQNYLLSLFIGNNMKIEVDYVISNMIYENLRYNYFKNMRLSFSNEIYKQEYSTYKNIGWIFDEKVETKISGSEFLISKKLTSFKYDIGFFSSAYWARRDGLYIVDDISELKLQKYINNIYSRIEMIILKYLIFLAKRNGLTLKIYLHPYEKRLIDDYSFYPPYWDLCESNVVDIDKDISKSNFFEAKVGVVLQSSIFYDRWEHNLYTSCFQFENSKNELQIPLKYLGKYSIYGFKNRQDLLNNIQSGLRFYE